MGLNLRAAAATCGSWAHRIPTKTWRDATRAALACWVLLTLGLILYQLAPNEAWASNVLSGLSVSVIKSKSCHLQSPGCLLKLAIAPCCHDAA